MSSTYEGAKEDIIGYLHIAGEKINIARMAADVFMLDAQLETELCELGCMIGEISLRVKRKTR